MNRLPQALLILALGLPLSQAGDQSTADEYEIKAAMLVNLTKFVEWPAAKLGDAGSPFVIGVLGHDPFGHDLDKQLAGKSVAGHPVVIQRLTAGGSQRRATYSSSPAPNGASSRSWGLSCPGARY